MVVVSSGASQILKLDDAVEKRFFSPDLTLEQNDAIFADYERAPLPHPQGWPEAPEGLVTPCACCIAIRQPLTLLQTVSARWPLTVPSAYWREITPASHSLLSIQVYVLQICRDRSFFLPPPLSKIVYG